MQRRNEENYSRFGGLPNHVADDQNLQNKKDDPPLHVRCAHRKSRQASKQLSSCQVNLSVKLDHILGDSIWWNTINQLGFDATVISSNASPSSNSQKAHKKESNVHLQIGKKEKFNQDDHTD